MSSKGITGIVLNLLLLLALTAGMFYYKSEYEAIRADKVLVDINLVKAQETITKQNKAIEEQANTMKEMDSALSEIKAKPPEIRYKKIYAKTRTKGDSDECKKLFNIIDSIDNEFINGL